MIEFTEEERASFTEMRALTKDAQDREVLVGLTAEETALVIERRRRQREGYRDPDVETKKAHIELWKKHESARLAVIGTEIYVRNENPTRH